MVLDCCCDRVGWLAFRPLWGHDRSRKSGNDYKPTNDGKYEESHIFQYALLVLVVPVDRSDPGRFRVVVSYARARVDWRTSRRKSGAKTSIVRHISYKRERMRAPMRSSSESSLMTFTRSPLGRRGAGSVAALSSK